MINFYEETCCKLESYGKTEKDIRWIGNHDGYFDMTGITLKDIFDFEYDNGYGGAEIDMTLFIVGDDWWLERAEYDGAEWWEFKTMPIKPAYAAKQINIFHNRRW